jgi:hypothetical protein
MRSKHIFLLWLFYAFLSGISAQTIDSTDVCYQELKLLTVMSIEIHLPLQK